MPNDRCVKHRKNFEGVCNWCGKKVCPLCIAGRNGNKVYCDVCVQKLGPPPKKSSLPPVGGPTATERAAKEDDDVKIEPYY
jgi:hypothetical protein